MSMSNPHFDIYNVRSTKIALWLALDHQLSLSSLGVRNRLWKRQFAFPMLNRGRSLSIAPYNIWHNSGGTRIYFRTRLQTNNYCISDYWLLITYDISQPTVVDIKTENYKPIRKPTISNDIFLVFNSDQWLEQLLLKSNALQLLTIQ